MLTCVDTCIPDQDKGGNHCQYVIEIDIQIFRNAGLSRMTRIGLGKLSVSAKCSGLSQRRLAF